MHITLHGTRRATHVSVARTHSIFMPSMMSVSSSVVCVLVLSFSCVSPSFTSSLLYPTCTLTSTSSPVATASRELTTAHLTIRVLHFKKKIGRCLVGPCFSFIWNIAPVLLPSSPFFKCSFIGMVFQCKCFVLSDLFFSPSMFRKIRAIYCVPFKPPHKNSLAMTILCILVFFSTYHVLYDTLFDAMIDHAWHRGIGSSLSRIQGSTVCQICLCWIVDSFQYVARIFRMCSFRHQFHNARRKRDTFSSKRSRRTRRFRLDWNGWSPPASQCLSATFSCLGDFSNCSTNLLTVSLRLVSTCSTVECGMLGIWKSTRPLLQVSLCSCSSLSQSWDFLESVIGRSFRLCCEFGTSVTRGNLGDWCTLQYNSSPVFMHTTFSKRIAGSVPERIITCDRVW